VTTLKGWIAAAHPVPVALVIVLTGLVAVASADGKPDATKLTLVLLAMLLSQLAIGWSNDYLDRETDALHQPWKPIPSGVVRATAMPPAIVAALVASLSCGFLLGAVPLGLLVAGTACGLVYNLWLKDTAFSGLPFVIALGLLPAFVWVSLDISRDEFLLLYIIGTPLALAAHVANGIPDIEADEAAGRRGLAASLGRSKALLLVFGCLSASMIAALAGPDHVWQAAEFWLALLAAVCLSVAARIAYARDSRSGDVWGFRLVALAGIVLSTGWLAAV
jgi:4-hydroxybenzoate polyprenyltransferase